MRELPRAPALVSPGGWHRRRRARRTGAGAHLLARRGSRPGGRDAGPLRGGGRRVGRVPGRRRRPGRAAPGPAGGRGVRAAARAIRVDDPYLVQGFAGGHHTESRGRLGGRVGPGWVQLEHTSGHRIDRGFSGAPVWDDVLRAVVGIVVTAHAAVDGGNLVPVEEITRRWPPAAGFTGWRSTWTTPSTRTGCRGPGPRTARADGRVALRRQAPGLDRAGALPGRTARRACPSRRRTACRPASRCRRSAA